MPDIIIPILFMLVFIIIGIGLLYYGYYLKKGVLKKCSLPVEAEVTESHYGRKYSTVRYKAWIDGRERDFLDPERGGGYYIYAPKVGEKVTLYVDPESKDERACVLPKRARSAAKITDWIGAAFVLMGLLGMAMIIIQNVFQVIK